MVKDKVIVVTGATSGIGEVTARSLAADGAHVILVARNADKARAVAAGITAATPGATVEIVLGDLSVQADVRRVAAELGARPRIDVLINNAGALALKSSKTVDGVEQTFALNHLGYYLLTRLLLPRLRASAPSRIVNVASGAHAGAKLDFEHVEGPGGWKGYSQSKLCNILFTYALARRLEGSGVTVNALHPGFVDSGFGNSNGAFSSLLMPVARLFAVSVAKGADTMTWLARAPEVEGVSGKYFYKRKPDRSSKVSIDEATQEKLWELSATLCGLPPEDAPATA